MMRCLHANVTITFYDEKTTEYRIVDGEIANMNEDIEPQPLKKVDIECHTCDLCVTYADWHQAPEPLLTYCRQIHQQEYGIPDEERSCQ